MRRLKLYLLFISVMLLAQGALAQAHAQGAGGFAGDWEAIEYPTSRDELPPAYKDLPLREVPRFSLNLTIRQRGNRLTGDYGGTARYLARLEEGGTFRTTARGNSARLRVESGFGGHATALLTLRGNRLYWKIVEQQGEHYFPQSTVLHRLKARRRP